MERNVKEILEKVKVTANQAAEAAGKLADVAGKKANEFVEATKLSVKQFDLNAEIEILYKEIGKSIYLTHTGVEVAPEEIEEKLVRIDEKFAQIEEIKGTLAERKAVCKCANCGREYGKADSFCAACGFEIK